MSNSVIIVVYLAVTNPQLHFYTLQDAAIDEIKANNEAQVTVATASRAGSTGNCA